MHKVEFYIQANRKKEIVVLNGEPKKIIHIGLNQEIDGKVLRRDSIIKIRKNDYPFIYDGHYYELIECPYCHGRSITENRYCHFCGRSGCFVQIRNLNPKPDDSMKNYLLKDLGENDWKNRVLRQNMNIW